MAVTDVTKTKYYQYASDVISGKVVAGELIKLACQRFISDLKRDDLEFRPKIIERFTKFASLLRHFKAETSGKPFILEPWQEFIAANILGFYYKESGRRRFTDSLIFIARKNGKTALAALFCLWFLIGDGEDGAEVDLAANSFEQSQLAYEFVENWAKQLDPQQRDLKIYRKQIKLDINHSKLNVFASDTKKLDGFNAHFALLDEYHAAKKSDMFDVLKSSQGQRRNPHLMVISTAGYLLNGPLKKMYDVDVEILRGIKSDDRTFAMLFTLDEGDDWTDESVWPKVCPNYGITVDPDKMRSFVTMAKNNPSSEVGVLTKNFNVWCSTSTTWIQDSYIQKSMQAVNLDDFKEDDVVFGGVDLSATGDLTCVSFLLTKEDDDRLYFKNLYYLPESALTESPNKQLYQYWARTKQLTVTSGNVVDYDYILADIMRVYNKLNVRKLGLDRWNASQFQISATEEGLPIEPVSQSIGNLNRPTKELERLIRSGKVVIDNNELNLFCFRNAVPKYDWNENIKITKVSYENKIDGVVAMIMALCVYLDTPRFTGSILTL